MMPLRRRSLGFKVLLPVLCIVAVMLVLGVLVTVRLMSEHIDVDTSGLLQREMTLDQAGDQLLECMLRTANGRLTAAEALGHREFVLTRLFESA
jgi:altronate dehydratase